MEVNSEKLPLTPQTSGNTSEQPAISYFGMGNDYWDRLASFHLEFPM